MIKQLLKSLFIVLLLLLCNHNKAEAQFWKRIFHKKTEAERGKEAQKEKEYQEERKREKAYNDAQKYFLGLQTKKVRKRMKRSRKQAEKNSPF